MQCNTRIVEISGTPLESTIEATVVPAGVRVRTGRTQVTARPTALNFIVVATHVNMTPDATLDEQRTIGSESERQHAREVAAGERFAFGANWQRFLTRLDDGRIARAVESLRDMLEVDRLDGVRFLDVGSGSGLFSLAARTLGAHVHSFDFDPTSVACTAELKRRFFPDDDAWTVEQGSALDKSYLDRLGSYDVVYSWGVLHHTGSMWRALDLVSARVAPRGRLFIAIYNDQGRASRLWRRVKQAYNVSPGPLRSLVLAPTFLVMWGPLIARDTLRLDPLRTWRRYDAGVRGMSPWHDVVDWVGGLPFEVATPQSIFDFFRRRRFSLARLVTRYGHGCNEFVFQRLDG